MIKKYMPYIISLLLTFGVTALGSFLAGDSTSFYTNLIQPELSPPSYIFGIVWPVLYILMAIAVGLVYTQKCSSIECKDNKKSAIKLYVVQLVMNALWPVLFFRFELFLISFIWLVVLWILILKMIIEFYKINKLAAYLLVPYLLWVTFAGYLNFMIWILN